MSSFTNKIIKSIQVSPPDSKNNCLVIVVDIDGSNEKHYLLEMKCEGSMMVTALLFALASFATIDYWTTDYVDKKGYEYIASVQINGSANGQGYA